MGPRDARQVRLYLLVVRSSWNDNISKFLGWHAKFFKSWLDIVDVLVKNKVHIPSQFIHILQYSLSQPTVGIRVDKQLHVEHVADLKKAEMSIDTHVDKQNTYLRVVERQDSFKKHNIHFKWMNSGVLVLDTGV